MPAGRINNLKNNENHDVRLAYRFQQPRGVGLGCCYGFSSVWALGHVLSSKDYFAPTLDKQDEEDYSNEDASESDDDIEKYYSSESEEEIEEEIEEEDIQVVTEKTSISQDRLMILVKSYQSDQILPRHERNGRVFLYHDGLCQLLDRIEKNLENQDEAAILNCSGIVGGHALGLRKTKEGTIEVFDCNVGKMIVKDMPTLKAWLPTYLDINYVGYFYRFSTDRVRKEPASVLSNAINQTQLFLMSALVSPLGVYHGVRALGRVIQRMGNKPSSPPEQVSTPVRLTTKNLLSKWWRTSEQGCTCKASLKVSSEPPIKKVFVTSAQCTANSVKYDERRYDGLRR